MNTIALNLEEFCHRQYFSFMRLVRRTFLVFLCGVFLCGSCGDALFVQSIAWTKMMFTFAQQGSLHFALKKTFDGKHPCKICREIKRKNARSPQLAASSVDAGLKFLYKFSKTVFEFRSSEASAYLVSKFAYAKSLDYPPLRRPPRLT